MVALPLVQRKVQKGAACCNDEPCPYRCFASSAAATIISRFLPSCKQLNEAALLLYLSGAPFSTLLLKSLSSSSFASSGTQVQQDVIIPPATLTIVMPAYDEANRIVKTLETYTAYIEGNNHTLLQKIDVLVVNDGSTDDTAAVVLDFARCTRVVVQIHSMHVITDQRRQGGSGCEGYSGARTHRSNNAGIENLDSDGSLFTCRRC